MPGALPTLEHYRAVHGVRDVLVHCLNHRCHHSATLNVDFLPDGTVLKALEPRMVCTNCGIVGAEVRPDWGSRPLHYGNVPLNYQRPR